MALPREKFNKKWKLILRNAGASAEPFFYNSKFSLIRIAEAGFDSNKSHCRKRQKNRKENFTTVSAPSICQSNRAGQSRSRRLRRLSKPR
jgi:hypothetical protein